MKLEMFKRKSKGDIAFDIFNIIFMTVICFITIYPIWFTVVNSFNEGLDAMSGGIYWWPRKFSLENYVAVFENKGIITSFGVTVAKTVIGTVVHVLFTAMVAYALSKKELVGRNFYFKMGLVTLFFGGGLIPYYLTIKNLGLLDTFWVYIIPAAFSFFDLIIFVSFFRELPAGLEEAAEIDGADSFTILFKIILPISMPVIATIALFHGVYQWNDYFTGMIYTNKESLQPIQTYLYKIVAQSSASNAAAAATGTVNRTITSQSIKFATMVVTTLPIVCVYPFLQKYFVKGMLVGSIKG